MQPMDACAAGGQELACPCGVAGHEGLMVFVENEDAAYAALGTDRSRHR